MESKELRDNLQTDFEVSVLNLLEKENRDFLTVTQVRKRVPINLLNRLKLKRSSNNSVFVKKIKPFLNGKLSYYKSRYAYIGYRKSDDELIKTFLTDKNCSAKKTASQIPLTKIRFTKALNKLISDGAVLVSINENMHPILNLASSKVIEDDKLFEDLFPHNNRSFIRIHKLREKSSWGRERFDKALKSLSVSGKIQLLGGDPSELTQEEIENSYVDSKGRLRIMITWRG